MLQGINESEFGQLVAALWERQGWQTQVKRDDGRLFVAVQRSETDEEGLLWALAGEEVGGKQVQQFASLCEEYGVEEAAIVTPSAVSDHAEKVASGTGVELLDGEGIVAILNRKGWTDLAERYAGGDGEDATDDESDGDSPLDQLQVVRERATAVASRVSDADLPVSPTVAVVAVVALLAAGLLVGPSLPFLGGASPVSAASTTPNQTDTTLHVAWNAKVVDSIDPNASDAKAYYPPEGEQFVVVRLRIKNTGESKVALTQAAFQLRTDERSYGFQSLADHDGFLDFAIAPGQRYVGWTAFSVPEGTTATLVYDQNATAAGVAVEFERDESLPVTVTQR